MTWDVVFENPKYALENCPKKFHTCSFKFIRKNIQFGYWEGGGLANAGKNGQRGIGTCYI